MLHTFGLTPISSAKNSAPVKIKLTAIALKLFQTLMPPGVRKIKITLSSATKLI
jgi:hypothetical protein